MGGRLGGSAAHRAVTGQQHTDQSQPEQQDETNGRRMLTRCQPFSGNLLKPSRKARRAALMPAEKVLSKLTPT